jgi:hypothetical protein
MSWANAVRAVSEKDCCVLKFVGLGTSCFKFWSTFVVDETDASGASARLLGW